MKHVLITLLALGATSSLAHADDETALQRNCKVAYLGAWSKVAKEVMTKTQEQNPNDRDGAFTVYTSIMYNSNEAKLLNSAAIDFCKSLGQLK